jgi:hypothetical protein
MSTEEKRSLRNYTSDLHALETHFMNAIRKQKTSKKVMNENVIDLLHEADKMVSGHVEVLDSQLKRLGGSVKADIKTKLASFAGSVAGLIDEARSDSVSKMMRDDYVALSMITIGYTMLHTHALADEDGELAKVTMEHMSDCTGMITEISKIVPLTVAGELIDNKEHAEEIGRKALENTQAAWSPEVVNREPAIV